MYSNIKTVHMAVDKSSLINYIEWRSCQKSRQNGDPNGDLILTFVKGGKYEYADVPSSILEALVSAKSIGTFFHENIRDQYKSFKWAEAEEEVS